MNAVLSYFRKLERARKQSDQQKLATSDPVDLSSAAAPTIDDLEWRSAEEETSIFESLPLVSDVEFDKEYYRANHHPHALAEKRKSIPRS